MSFKDLGLNSQLLANIEAKGYSEATLIQKMAIPVILSGKDILAGSQTGTGKTAAFTLPILQLLSEKQPAGKKPKVLVLTPTRELAAQVGANIATYGKGLPIRSTIIFGGVSMQKQVKELNIGVDIVIGTPGRLLDLESQSSLDLSEIRYLVLDEADRMVDMGFIHDIRKIIRLVPVKRQTLFFSATYSDQVKTLANTILKNPETLEVTGKNTAATLIEQSVYHIEKTRKKDLLIHLIEEGNWNQVLIFTKTKHGANRLAQQLTRENINSTAIHGNKSQNARTRALADFKSLKVRVLVATDIAARGLDIDKLPHVINYDLPLVAEDYVHRIGRTGRAGATGEAISLVDPSEISLMNSIEKLLKCKIPVKPVGKFKVTPQTPATEDTREPRKNSGNSSKFFRNKRPNSQFRRNKNRNEKKRS